MSPFNPQLNTLRAREAWGVAQTFQPKPSSQAPMTVAAAVGLLRAGPALSAAHRGGQVWMQEVSVDGEGQAGRRRPGPLPHPAGPRGAALSGQPVPVLAGKALVPASASGLVALHGW